MAIAGRAVRLAVYPVSNFAFFLILSWMVSQADYNQYVYYFSIANLLVVIGGIGLGGALVDFAHHGQKIGRSRVLTLVTVYTVLFLGTLLALGQDPIIGVLGIAFVLYSLTEYALKGAMMLRELMLLRYGAATAVSLLTLSIWAQEMDVETIVIARALLIFFLIGLFLHRHRRVWAIIPPSGRVTTGTYIRQSSMYSLTALSTVGIHSIDKILLAGSFDSHTLFVYSLMFFASIMIGNRYTDLLLSQSLCQKGSPIRPYLPLFVAEFLGIALLLLAIRMFYPEGIFSLLEIFLFSATAVALSVSDFLWWNRTVASSTSSRYAKVSTATFLFYVVLYLLIRPETIVAGILILLTSYLFSTTAYFLIPKYA